MKQQCQAILVNGPERGKRCREAATDKHQGRLVCWTHMLALEGPRYQKGAKARFSPVRFAG